MSDFVQDFIYKILSLQEKLLKKKSKRVSSNRISASATLDLSAKSKVIKEKTNNSISSILKKYNNNPQKLLEFVEAKGTKIYRIPFADKILRLIGREEGLICSLKGIKALYLTFVLRTLRQDAKISLNLVPIFVLSHKPMENCILIQQFYKWYSLKMELPGFDENSQENFNKFLYSSNDSKLSELSIDEIIGLKDAIERDVEAINFVVELVRSTDSSKQALSKITTGGASI